MLNTEEEVVLTFRACHNWNRIFTMIAFTTDETKNKTIKGEGKLNENFNFALESIPFQCDGITEEVLLEQRCERCWRPVRGLENVISEERLCELGLF